MVLKIAGFEIPSTCDSENLSCRRKWSDRLERLIATSQSLEGTVLRYGQLYGPGTGNVKPTGSAPLHVDAAAQAALLAVEPGITRIFNIAEDNGFVSTEKARRELGWDPRFRISFGTDRVEVF